MAQKRNTKGEGSFKQNPDGSITHRKTVGYKPNGYRKVITVTSDSIASCIKKMQIKEAEWNKQMKMNKVSSITTVIDLCMLHLQYQVDMDELKPKSRDRREFTINKHIEPYPIGHMQVQSVRSADVDDHINRLMKEGKLSVSSIEKVVDVLNAAYSWAIMRGDLDFNPVAPVKPSLSKRLQKLRAKDATDPDVVVLSPDEITAFEEEALRKDEKTARFVHPAGPYGVFLLHTGLRCGELLALRWKDVDWKYGYLTIEKSRSIAKNRGSGPEKYTLIEGTTKNQKSRKIKLLPEAMAVLEMIKQQTDSYDENNYIAVTRTGRPNTPSNLEHGMLSIFEDAGITDQSGSLHILRRTFATQLYEKGIRIKEIAAYIGDLESTTEKYYIAVRRRMVNEGKVEQVVILPENDDET